jgi:hypothetical protein
VRSKFRGSEEKRRRRDFSLISHCPVCRVGLFLGLTGCKIGILSLQLVGDSSDQSTRGFVIISFYLKSTPGWMTVSGSRTESWEIIRIQKTHVVEEGGSSCNCEHSCAVDSHDAFSQSWEEGRGRSKK